MRIGLQTWGTEGDIRPFFALAQTLKERGHDVDLVYSNVEGRDLASLGRAAGIAAQEVGGDTFRRHRERIAARARENFRIGNPVKQLDRIFEDTLDPIADEMYEAGRQLAARSQLVVAHFLAHPVISAADAAATPYACLAFAPVFPTRHYPPMGAPRLGPLLNPMLWWVADRAMDSILAARVNRIRERAGLPTARDVSAQLRRRARLSLLAMSPLLLPRPADWDARIQLCGFLSLQEDGREGALDPQLLRFLDSGPPPAFFSLGSMANLDEEPMVAAVQAMVEATSRLGARAVVQMPEAVLAKARHAENIHYLSRAPHALLFPRCSVLVHHGGAGTTHAALRAGRPSIVVPHIADQFFWADVLRRLVGSGRARVLVHVDLRGDERGGEALLKGLFRSQVRRLDFRLPYLREDRCDLAERADVTGELDLAPSEALGIGHDPRHRLADVLDGDERQPRVGLEGGQQPIPDPVRKEEGRADEVLHEPARLQNRPARKARILHELVEIRLALQAVLHRLPAALSPSGDAAVMGAGAGDRGVDELRHALGERRLDQVPPVPHL